MFLVEFYWLNSLVINPPTSNLSNSLSLPTSTTLPHTRVKIHPLHTFHPRPPSDSSDEKATESQTNPCQYFLTGTYLHPFSLCSALPCKHCLSHRFCQGKRALVTHHQDSLYYADNRNRTCTVSHWNLNPARLPVPPYPHTVFKLKKQITLVERICLLTLTGLAGFEPASAGVKVLCLTAWR